MVDRLEHKNARGRSADDHDADAGIESGCMVTRLMILNYRDHADVRGLLSLAPAVKRALRTGLALGRPLTADPLPMIPRSVLPAGPDE